MQALGGVLADEFYFFYKGESKTHLLSFLLLQGSRGRIGIGEHGGEMEVKDEMGLVQFDVYMPAWVERLPKGNITTS